MKRVPRLQGGEGLPARAGLEVKNLRSGVGKGPAPGHTANIIAIIREPRFLDFLESFEFRNLAVGQENLV